MEMPSSSDCAEVNHKDNVVHRKKTEIVKGISNSKSIDTMVNLSEYIISAVIHCHIGYMCGESTLESVYQLITRKK